MKKILNDPASYVDEMLDGLVADARAESVPTLETDVRLDDAAARRRVAEETLRFALALGRSREWASTSIARTCARPPSSP